MGSALCKLCGTKYFGNAFLFKCICVSSFCVQELSAPNGLFVQETSLWQWELSGVQNSWDELRRTLRRWERLISATSRWKQLRRTYLDILGDMWEEMRWDEKSWDEVRGGERRWEEVTGGEKRWEELTWFEMRWSVQCEVHVWREVRDVKIAVWSVRKVLAWRCIAPGSCAGHGLGQQPRNSFAQSMRARAWLAHGACKFYRLHRFYSISLRLLVYGFTCMVPAWYPVQLDSWNFYHYFRDPSLLVTVTSKEGSLVTLSWGISFPKKYDFWEYTE